MSASQTTTVRIEAGRRVVTRLKAIRRVLSTDEKEFAEYIEQAEKEIAAIAATSDDERIELILQSVERFHAHTLPEIVEDLGLPGDAVRDLVAIMLADGRLTQRARYTVGGSSKQMLLYSKRRHCTCE